ncbi:MAG: lysophospholipid acyltransferase family protein, partial [Bacteroidia bacterium]|nr:lysophospholipid acyltransferase family protein [Bacteroidia bacterium]
IVVVHHINIIGYGIYKRLKNKYFDRLARRIRGKYNTTLISSKEAKAVIELSEKSGIRSMSGFVSDQSPKTYKSRYWRSFMGIEVPCFTGAETLAKKLDLSVTFLKINKEKRGYYTAEFVSLADNPRDYKDFQITDKFTELVESQIRQAPEYYLWTHKRWKHRGKKSE